MWKEDMMGGSVEKADLVGLVVAECHRTAEAVFVTCSNWHVFFFLKKKKEEWLTCHSLTFPQDVCNTLFNSVTETNWKRWSKKGEFEELKGRMWFGLVK